MGKDLYKYFISDPHDRAENKHLVLADTKLGGVANILNSESLTHHNPFKLALTPFKKKLAIPQIQDEKWLTRAMVKKKIMMRFLKLATMSLAQN